MRDGARLTHGEIQEVVLVGGSTKIPKIQEMIRDSFKNSKIVNNINVDECVAIGAALEAAKIAKVTPENFTVREVTPFSLGIELVDKTFAKVIDRFTAISASKNKVFYNRKNVTRTKFDVYEGENRVAMENHLLGTFVLTDIPPLPANQVEFDVTFEIDDNGILKVTAVDSITKNQKSIEINYGKGRLAGVETRN
jgi:molecular chaperone DnaK (HSP70)